MEDDIITEEVITESKSETRKPVPQAEVHLYVRGQGPLHVLKCPLGGWDEDKLDLLQIMDDCGLKALYAFNPSSGRGLPIRYNPKNGLSMLSYRGKQVCIDGEPKVVNHGIPEMVVEEMLKVSSEYFEVPLEERQKFMSTDVRKPIRYGTSWNQLNDTCFCWRDFLKHYCHPLDEMVHMWPSNPPQYRCVVACYSEQVKLLATELMAAMMEHLEIKSTSIQKTFKNGSQMMVLNCYPPCPQPNLTLGMLPHSDYGCITILLQDEVEGLQVQDEGLWKSVRPLPGSFLINIGDHLEVLSNGRFKSAIHRVVVNSERSRVSVATVHSLPFHVKISPCPELIDEHHPKMYRDTNFNDFLNSLTCSRFNGIRFLDSIKLYTT